jgi:hypothetical protein
MKQGSEHVDAEGEGLWNIGSLGHWPP